MFERIVVGVSKTERAKKAARQAIDLATKFGADLHLVTAFPTSGGSASERDHAEGFLESMALGSALNIRTHALPGRCRRRDPAGRGRDRRRPHRRRQQGHARRGPSPREHSESHRGQGALLGADRQHDLTELAGLVPAADEEIDRPPLAPVRLHPGDPNRTGTSGQRTCRRRCRQVIDDLDLRTARGGSSGSASVSKTADATRRAFTGTQCRLPLVADGRERARRTAFTATQRLCVVAVTNVRSSRGTGTTASRNC